MKGRLNIILAGIVGNALEIYDFTLYGVLAPVLAVVFFPKHDPVVNLLFTLAIFATGFFMRPVGSLVFGYLGDRFGRKKALLLSINLMALPTLVIGILPSYSSIGIIATIFLVICRLLQGLCAGGELTGAVIFAVEHNKADRPGLTGGLIIMSSGIGALLAMSLGSFFLQKYMLEWMWRIPFLLGGIIAFVGFYIRRKTNESPEFEKVLFRRKLVKFPIIEIFRYNLRAMLCTMGLSMFGSIIAYSTAVYVNVYLISIVKITVVKSMFLSSLGLLLYTIACPISGYISDKVGQIFVLKSVLLLTLISAIPIFLLLSTGDVFYIIVAQIILGTLAGFFSGSEMTFINNLFPAEVRYTGVSFGYCIGLVFFGGGIMPFINTLFVNITGIKIFPSLYIMFSALIAFVAIKLSSKHQKDQNNEKKEYSIFKSKHVKAA